MVEEPDEDQRLIEEASEYLVEQGDYCNGALLQARKELRRLYPDAIFQFDPEGCGGTAEFPGEMPFRVFVLIYPEVHAQQIEAELADQRQEAGQEARLFFFVTPSQQAEKLQAFLQEWKLYGKQDSGYIWRLDMGGTPGKRSWMQNGLIPVFGEEGTRIRVSGD
jgi:hypothetical protein